MDAGGSCAGGNWKDNGNGSFSTSGQSPKTIKYSMLDLYLMGLATPAEVAPFGLLESVTAPADIKDPGSSGTSPYGPSSFPYFGDRVFTAKATRRTITMDEILAANGARIPAKADGKMNLGIVLMVKATATEAEIAALEAKFEPIAASLAPAYHEATHERGTLTNVTSKDIAPLTDAGSDPDAGAVAPAAQEAPGAGDGGGGCSVTPTTHGSIAIARFLAVAFVMQRRRSRPTSA